MSQAPKKQLIRLLQTLFVVAIITIGALQLQYANPPNTSPTTLPLAGASPAAQELTQLAIKGRAPKTGYDRSLFSDGWAPYETCDIRNVVLARDMENVAFVENTCKVSSGTLQDPYTGKTIAFIRGKDTSDDVQIDHVVALSDAWQKGAQQLAPMQRYALANDPLNLLAVDGPTNQAKGDSDAASWLPPNKSFRCSYVARQIAVKRKYSLWVTLAEYQTMARILTACPEQVLPKI